ESRTGARATEGVLHYDLTGGKYEPQDLSGKKYTVNWQLPEQFRTEGAEVVLSFIDIYGGVHDEKTRTDKNGNISSVVTCSKTTDFDPSKVIMFEVRFELMEKTPSGTTALLALAGMALANLLASLGWFYAKYRRNPMQGKNFLTAFLARLFCWTLVKGFLSKLRTFIKTFMKGKKQPAKKDSKVQQDLQVQQDSKVEEDSKAQQDSEVQQGPAATVPHEDLLDALAVANGEINDWVDKIGVDFRTMGAHEEEKGIFFPSLRKSELWEFFDKKAEPRYNLNRVYMSLKFIAAAAILYFSGYTGVIHLYPYAFLALISGLLNWRKVSYSIGWGAVFLFLQKAIPACFTGVPLTMVSLTLIVASVTYYTASLFNRYYKAISDPSTYIENQKDQLRLLQSILSFIERGATTLRTAVNEVKIDAIKSQNIGEKEKIEKFLKAVLAHPKISQVAKNYIKGKENIFKNDKKSSVESVKERLLALSNLGSELAPYISDLTRFKRSRDVAEWEDQPYEGGAVVRTEPFSTVLDGAIEELNGLLTSAQPNFAGLRSLKKKFAWIISALIAASGLGVYGAVVWGGLAPVVAIVGLPAVMVSVCGIFTIMMGREVKKLAIIRPAKDMRQIYRDRQKLIYVSGADAKKDKNLKAIDVRRFLVEIRAALMRASETNETVTVEDLKRHIDDAELPALNVRDTTTVRDFLDSFHLTKLEEWPAKLKMLARVAWWLFIFGAGSYLATVLGVAGIREVASLVSGTGWLGLNGLFENPFAAIEFVKLIFKGFVYWGEAATWIPLFLAQSFFGGAMLASLALFAGKFGFYFIGKYAKVSDAPEHKVVKPKIVIPHIAAGIAGVTTFILSMAGVFGPGLFGIGAMIISIGVVMFSGGMLWAMYKAKNRYKSIYQDDKLAETEESYVKFVKTILSKYTPEDLAVIKLANDLKRQYPGSWKQKMPHNDRMRYETLFGTGNEPSGMAYPGNLGAEDIEKVYVELSKEGILNRMSEAGFRELKEHMAAKDKKVDPGLTLWKAQGEPGLVKITAQELRDFLDTSLNEKKIVMMYDFLPKFTPWIVVVGGADAVFNLIQALLVFRYPLNKLKFIFAGENWDTEVQDDVMDKKKDGRYPPQLIYRGMAVREDGREGEPAQPYTKPGANTAVLHESDGISGVIYDAENTPNPNQPLQFVLGTIDGIANTRTVKDKFKSASDRKDWKKVEDKEKDINAIVERTRGNVGTAIKDYLTGLTPEERLAQHRFNFKTGNVLKRHLEYFTEHALRKLLELTQKDEKYFSTAVIWKEIEDTIVKEKNTTKAEESKIRKEKNKARKEGDDIRKERRELINLYITLCNMPGYGDLATSYIKRDMTEKGSLDKLIKGLVLGEFRRINEPKNGQGRLAKITTALHRSEGQVAAYMHGEYASWYTAGWDGFHAAQDTFKPLGGTTGYFCTENVEEIDWKDIRVIEKLGLNKQVEGLEEDGKPVVSKTYAELIKEHHGRKNKLLTLGAWDEFQVAEDYMLGFVSWFYGFNIAAFSSVTPEDPSGFESELNFKFRPKQMSRWNKGYIIGLLVATEKGNMKEIYERKGLWGLLVFFVPTLCSAVHPLMFRIARSLTIFWWIYFMPMIYIGKMLLSTSLAPYAVWFNNLTGLGTLLTDLQLAVGNIVPQILNFLPAGWAWGIGPAIVIIPIFIHRYFTMRGIFKGVDDKLGRQRILEEYDNMIREKLIGDELAASLVKAAYGKIDSEFKALMEANVSDQRVRDKINVLREDIAGLGNIHNDKKYAQKEKELRRNIYRFKGSLRRKNMPAISVIVGILEVSLLISRLKRGTFKLTDRGLTDDQRDEIEARIEGDVRDFWLRATGMGFIGNDDICDTADIA
ncbi:MAG: hypothetical protein ABIA77_04370, partial [Candidatus Omnitrophota bacterium]